MPSSPPRSHRVRERAKLTLQGYFTTARASLQGASVRARGPSSRGAGMIKVTRDQAELGDVPFIEFMVSVDRHNAPSEDQAIICGIYQFRDPVLGYGASKDLSLRAEAALFEAWCFALEKGISAIWIDDHEQQFDFEPWVRAW